MGEKNIESRVKEILTKYSEIMTVEDITPSTSLMEDLQLESIDFVEVMYEFETEFDLEISEEDMMDTLTVKDIINYLEKLVNSKKG